MNGKTPPGWLETVSFSDNWLRKLCAARPDHLHQSHLPTSHLSVTNVLVAGKPFVCTSIYLVCSVLFGCCVWCNQKPLFKTEHLCMGCWGGRWLVEILLWYGSHTWLTLPHFNRHTCHTLKAQAMPPTWGVAWHCHCRERLNWIFWVFCYFLIFSKEYQILCSYRMIQLLNLKKNVFLWMFLIKIWIFSRGRARLFF